MRVPARDRGRLDELYLREDKTEEELLDEASDRWPGGRRSGRPRPFPAEPINVDLNFRLPRLLQPISDRLLGMPAGHGSADMTVSLSPFPGSQPCRLAVKVEGPQQQQQLHAVSPPSSAAREKHRPSMLHTDRSKFGSVSSLPPYEALYGASRSAQDGSPILDMVPTEVAEAQAEPPLPSLPRTLEARVESLEGDSEIELDESIQLDRLVLRSSLALAAAQAVLAGTLSVRGAILDLNSRDVEGDAGLERIEVETHIRSVALRIL